ncbi:hypothetical protein CEXT_47251 [Caerostris extrusa]|uniref:Uncharacterized protein n=1 Tax=Caerostris extrusa TaxID=172846 RepID=A0AAV4MY50_CAEEX|nr:hypothetical protein CEXT_47251 [Caerostris extrusa]
MPVDQKVNEPSLADDSLRNDVIHHRHVEDTVATKWKNKVKNKEHIFSIDCGDCPINHVMIGGEVKRIDGLLPLEGLLRNWRMAFEFSCHLAVLIKMFFVCFLPFFC